MQRINMTHPGGVDVLYIEDAALPAPEAGELLIKTAYAGVNRPDIMQREGVYPMPAGVTPIMGLEFSGEVVALGAGVSGIAVGDSVCALTDDGAYAEYYVVKASQTLPLRAGYSLQEAAMLPETAFTFMEEQMTRDLEQLDGYFKARGQTLVTGIPAGDLKKQLFYNAIITLGDGNGRYYKHHLLPFGEYVPLRSWLTDFEK